MSQIVENICLKQLRILQQSIASNVRLQQINRRSQMSMNKQQVLKYINLARQYPKYYLNLIDEHLNSFVDDFNIKLAPDIIYQTIEGKSLWHNARQFINQQPPITPLQLHPGLAKAAADHVSDIVKNLSTGHQGSDGSTFMDRVQRYCKKRRGNMIELIGATYIIPSKNSIEVALLNLIVDDGVANRGHRRALFSKEYKYIGMQFFEREDKIYSVISMSQSNLQLLRFQPQSIATSTSHLQTLTQIHPYKHKVQQLNNKGKENSAETYQNRVVSSSADQVWTLRNVTSDVRSPNKQNISSKQTEQMQAQPSIFKQVEAYHQSSQSLTDSNPFVSHENKGSVLSNQNKSKKLKTQIKQSSLKNSQQLIKSDNKDKHFNSYGFGNSSTLQNFRLKSSLNSAFYKSPSKGSGFGSTVGGKRIVEKKQMMKTWNQDEFLVKQVVTIVKYDDGTVQDFVQKHSILKQQSLLKHP